MSIVVQIPNSLRDYCQYHGELAIDATTVAEGLVQLKLKYPDVFHCLCDETGKIRRHIHLYLNQTFLDSSDPATPNVPLTADDELTFWTAVSGG
jgi:hypothetical protein